MPQSYTAYLTQLGQTSVSVQGYLYLVDFGPGTAPRRHLVDRQRRCTCGLLGACPAVLAVIEYLADGGAEAPAPPPGYFPSAPVTCPQCGAPARFDQSLCSPKRGAGWVCEAGGAGHYWRWHFSILAERIKANPWLFPPVFSPDGEMLYPGLLRDECLPASLQLPPELEETCEAADNLESL